jgi:hypothetical protein
MSANCFVAALNPEKPNSYSEVIAYIDKAFENKEKSHLVVIKKSGEVVYGFGEKDVITNSKKEYQAMVKDLEGAKFFFFEKSPTSLVRIVSGLVQPELGGFEDGMLDFGVSVFGALDTVLIVTDNYLKLTGICQTEISTL